MPKRHLQLVPDPKPVAIVFELWYYAPDLTGAVSDQGLSQASADRTFKVAKQLRSRHRANRFRVFSLDMKGAPSPRHHASRIFYSALRSLPPVHIPPEELSLNRPELLIMTRLLKYYQEEATTRFVVVTDLTLMSEYFDTSTQPGQLRYARIIYPPTGAPSVVIPK
jgi:hypothetical protein